VALFEQEEDARFEAAELSLVEFEEKLNKAVAVLWGSNKSMESKNRSWEAARAVVA